MRETTHFAFEHPEAGMTGRFFAALEEELHAEADAQVRPLASEVFAKRVAEGSDERFAAFAKRPLPRHHQPRRVAYGGRVTGDRRFGTDAKQRLMDAVKVAQTEVDDGHAGGHDVTP